METPIMNRNLFLASITSKMPKPSGVGFTRIGLKFHQTSPGKVVEYLNKNIESMIITDGILQFQDL